MVHDGRLLKSEPIVKEKAIYDHMPMWRKSFSTSVVYSFTIVRKKNNELILW